MISWSRTRNYNKLTISVMKNITHDCLIICHISYNHVQSGTVCFLLWTYFIMFSWRMTVDNISLKTLMVYSKTKKQKTKTNVLCNRLADYYGLSKNSHTRSDDRQSFRSVFDGNRWSEYRDLALCWKKHPLLWVFFSQNLGVLP